VLHCASVPICVAATNEKEFLELGGIQSLLHGASKHVTHPGAVEAIAGAIRNLTFRNGAHLSSMRAARASHVAITLIDRDVTA
jgi:hypothetical protein